MLTPITYAAYRDIPASYMICTEDKIILPQYQEKMVAAAGVLKTVERIRSAHSPFLSRPEEVVRMIENGASASS